MTTVPGTYFTKEQLEADLRVDEISAGNRTGSERTREIGFGYHTEKKQYHKALAWYLLAARENNSIAMANIGVLYTHGYGVPKNYFCALQWQLKSIELIDNDITTKNIGTFFEYGNGVPRDKLKALEWYHHSTNKRCIDRMIDQGYYLSESDKKKTLQQLIKETEAIIDVERKKLKQKQGKSQEEMEALVDITITSKLTGDGKDAWKDVPILFADNKQRYSRSASNSGANNKNGILEMNKQIQQNTGVQNQARQFEQRATILELQTKERDSELVLLRNDQQSLQLGTSRVQYQIAKSDSKINSLQSKNQEQKLKIISLEYQLKEKDNTMNSLENEKKTLSTANQFIIEMVETQKSLLQSKINEMELLRQNMERQLADEKKRNEVLEHEIRALKRERAQDQTSTSLLSNDRTNPTNVGSNRGGDDDSAQNNINYDSELDNTEERQDDEVNDINYDTPSEDGDK